MADLSVLVLQPDCLALLLRWHGPPRQAGWGAVVLRQLHGTVETWAHDYSLNKTASMKIK
jgi:hypothetical protein